MANEQQRDPDYERRRRIAAKRRRERERRRKIAMIKRAVVFGVLLVIMLVLVVVAINLIKKDKKHDNGGSITNTESLVDGTDSGTSDGQEATAEPEPAIPVGDLNAPEGSKDEVMASAYKMYAQYDYDNALAKLLAYEDQTDPDIIKMIADVNGAKSSCVAVDVNTVPHIFFHSLINDNRAFIVTDQVTEGRVTANNAAMATVDEFNHVINQMYEAGFVMIALDDMVIRNGDGSFTPNNNIMLPQGKKAFIMSEDDLSYYHSYGEKGVQGYADRLVIDENGKVKCEYYNQAGERLIGDYDMVPLIDSFIEAHPDFAYHDARPTVALTGYNGVLGYITNNYYCEGPESENLGTAQKNFLLSHPDWNFDQDCAEARKIAEAMKANGWTFASHTYGHLNA
ncbi:MAG: hypothetical protein KBS83_04550, partial [Lachnospiraceae bacterium]|nr:hypothetical protein [Candidatus Equihabitans merdae]